jgi:Phage MuF-C-terminal domain
LKTNFETLVDVIICAEKEGSPRHELILSIGSTPERRVGLGFQDLRLAVKAKTIGKMFFEHGLTQGLIEKIPTILEAPKAIYRSDTHPTNMVVLTYELKAGAPIIIPIARDRQIGRGPRPARTPSNDGSAKDCCCGKRREEGMIEKSATRHDILALIAWCGTSGRA